MPTDTMAALMLLAALQVADVYTTYRVLELGGKEMNPLMRAVLEKAGFAGLTIVKLVIIGGVTWSALLGFMPTWVIWCLVALYVWVVAHNWKQLKKALKR